ncbi:MAG: Thrombospondin type 3 repeat superfamily protein [Parcubacteria group bacterium GW2011_GWB1_43_8]|nr:MAG: Thrombospondin type 3 repeat superfamily protein [Parcubacteria group bacterium GW2011_GWB1_43_8]
MAYLPNKKIWFLLVFILLIFAGWFYFSGYKNKQAEYVAEEEKSSLAVVLEQTSQLDADTDGDGLKDWEELLWKTDPNKADTDGDGTNDNEEITLNRNPLKAGPDDKISDKEDLVAQEKAVSDSKQNTLTAAYARKFLTDYMTLKQQKGVLTEEDKQSLVQSFMDNIEPLTVADKYSMADIKITGDTSDSIKKYASEMKKIFIDEKQGLVSEPEVFKTLMKSIQSGEDFQKDIDNLNYSIGKYEELIKGLIGIIVPEGLSENHLEAINAFNNVKFAIKNMTLASTDPVKAVTGRKLYDNEIKRAYNALVDMQTVFDRYKIYVFNNL